MPSPFETHLCVAIGTSYYSALPLSISRHSIGYCLSEMARKYVLRRRAERQEETKRKIVEAALELHRTVGPARSSFSAVAERAGVERKTLYRHFPDQESLFAACRSRYLTLHPPPNPTPWLEIGDPESRLRKGLTEAYAYYGRNEAMMTNILRDVQILPVGAGFLRHRAQMVEALAAAWTARGRRRQRVMAALRVALDFQVWRSLVREDKLSDREAIDLMVALVCEAGKPATSTQRSSPLQAAPGGVALSLSEPSSSSGPGGGAR
jgi:AcrR family transcriptional regulator